MFIPTSPLYYIGTFRMPPFTRILHRPLSRTLVVYTLLGNKHFTSQILRGFFSGQLCRHHDLPRAVSSLKYEHFFRYTSGRWLWDEENQLRERVLVFNVEELKRIAAVSVGAKSCVSITKLVEGGYNKVFRLVMDNGFVAIARIPNPKAGAAHKMTASEVATMDFVRILYH